MALSKEQYDNIMMQYSAARDRHRHELERRRLTVYAKIPGYRALEDAVPDLAFASLKSSLYPAAGEDATPQSVQDRIDAIGQKKKALLTANGFPEDYLTMTYDCPDCRDTGYIGTQKCHCLRAKEVALLYDQSHLRALAREENFHTLSYAWYQGEDLQHFSNAVRVSQNYVRNFRKAYENLYFYGTVGTGKSFLSVCIAGEILNMGESVLYFSAAGLFDRISSCLFNNRNREEYYALREDLYGCDLLIIDDLGTELTNSFVSAQLFSLLNERHLNRKSTIISTNLSLMEVQDRYSDRIFSRIASNYTVCKLTGPDIRVLKKVQRQNNTAAAGSGAGGENGTNKTS